MNSYTTGDQVFPEVSIDRRGRAAVAWFSVEQDGDAEGVFAQRLATEAVLDIDGSGDVGPLTDGLLALRFLFGFRGAMLTSGVVGTGCTRCNAAAIEPYLQGLV